MVPQHDTRALQEHLKVSFRERDLLIQALMHRSYLNEHKEVELEHNERLEFLGDAVLELVVTDHLFKTYPDLPEGEMTAFRAALVNTVHLSQVAEAMRLNDYLLLSRGEAQDTGRARQYLLANAVEAVIGALYLDQGYEAARDLIERFLLVAAPEMNEKKEWIDAKSRFQVLAQDKHGITPTYAILKETGPDHAKRFTSGVYLRDKLIAEGDGNSKQEAEQAAAEAAISNLS
jgi:ribonuclease-3